MPSQLHQVQHTVKISEIFAEFYQQLLHHINTTHAAEQLLGQTSTKHKIFNRIEYWVGTSAELAHIVCSSMVHSAPYINEAELKATPETIVNRAVKESILNYWEGSEAASHLSYIAQQLLPEEGKDLQLMSYLQILQRGTVKATGTPEQKVMLACGLITADSENHKDKDVNSGTLKVANAIYAYVFDLDWVEKQLPGITRPVNITKSATNNKTIATKPHAENLVFSDKPSTGSGLYSKIAVLTCCLAVAGAGVSAYRQEFRNEAFATQEDGKIAVLQATESAPTIDFENNKVTSDRALFDNGVEHATNSRWLPMVREFCQIPADSSYFTPAKRQLDKWVKLYQEDIAIAQLTFTQEESGECALVSDALDIK